MYKTLADLAGFPMSSVQADVQGVSLAPVFDDVDEPSLRNRTAYSEIGRCACQWYQEHGKSVHECGAGVCIHTPIAQFDYIGYTARTDEWRCALRTSTAFILYSYSLTLLSLLYC